jgi:urease accessory protein
VRARARLSIDGAGRIDRMVEDPPVAWRPTAAGVHLVGTAGGLTGDDDVGLEVDVAPGGCLVLRSGAATVVYAGTGTMQRVALRAGAGARVDWCPEPVVVTGGAMHTQVASVSVTSTTVLDWTEIVVLGRHDETPGSADLRLDCVVDDGSGGPPEPLLRHHLRVGPGATGWSGPAVLGAQRAVGVRLRTGPDLPAPDALHGDGWVWMRLDGPGWLLSAVAADLPTLRARMADAAA